MQEQPTKFLENDAFWHLSEQPNEMPEASSSSEQPNKMPVLRAEQPNSEQKIGRNKIRKA